MVQAKDSKNPSNISLQLNSYMKKIGLSIDSKEEKETDKEKKQTAKKEEKRIKKTMFKKKGKKNHSHVESNNNQLKENTMKPKKKNALAKSIFDYVKQEKLLLKNKVPWYEKVVDIAKQPSELPVEQLNTYLEVANQYWNEEVNLYQTMKDNDKSSDAQWLRTVLTSGTMADKLAALTMTTQESPIHGKRSLDSLISLSKKKSRREALIAIDSLRHLWISDLLPDRKLRFFHEYCIEDIIKLSKTGTNEDQIRLLITIAYENYLKKLYAEFTDVIQGLSKDLLMNIRNKVLGIIYELLVMKPEQEHKLLSMLVNKLGDPERQISSKASYLLQQLFQKHPNMHSIVIDEVERMMYRPNVSQKAQYYAVVFLNQTVLHHDKKDTANKLMKLYFNFFKVLAKQKETNKKRNEDTESQEIKIVSGLLSGVNRAFPFAESSSDIFDEHLDTLFKLTHSSHYSTSLQALMLIFQVMETRESIADRYYQALSQKLLDPEIQTNSKHAILLNLIFKSLKNDSNLNRVKSFMKRLLQQTCKEQPSLLCGSVFLLSEIVKLKPALRSVLEQPEDEDEEEHFEDVPDNESSVHTDEENDNGPDVQKPSWTFVKDNTHEKYYRISHRNPLYAGAEFSCAWEVSPLLSHFHPSVQHFSRFLLQGENIEYNGDPLQDFTLIRFLDRFMYRNPKKKEIERGTSIMQPKERSSRLQEEPLNSKSFIQKNESEIRDDEKFFHQFFKMKKTNVKKTNEKMESDIDSNDVDNFREKEDEIDFDFAGDMRRPKQSSDKPLADVDDDDESSDDQDAFDYDDIGSESDDDFGVEKQNFTDKDYEKALLENLSSEESDGDDDETITHADTDMFAAADEFAHLLEDDDVSMSKKSLKKREQWEERTADWKHRKRRRFHRQHVATGNKRKFSNTTKSKTNVKRKR